MSNSRRWREFIAWWSNRSHEDYKDKEALFCHICEKIYEIKKNEEQRKETRR